MEIDKEIGRILNGVQPGIILMTANQMGILDRLKVPTTAEGVAESLDLSLKGVERLLNALAGMGVLTKEDDRFHLPRAWQDFLTRDGDHSMQQWIQLSADLLPVWTRMPDFVRSGKHIQSLMDILGGQPEKMRAFTDAMHDKGLKATAMIAEEIPIDYARHMLDVGGGPGTYTLEWAKRYPHLRGTILDIPPVLEVAKEYIKRYGLEDRVDTRPGDFHKDDLGQGYDLVLLANVLHMYDGEMGKMLVSKAIRALEPGGRIILHGFCTDDGETSPLDDAIFNINIALLTEGGRAHPVSEKVRWLEEMGIFDIRHFRINAIPTGVITGIKPA